jgi:signal transduction histidine kinase
LNQVVLNIIVNAAHAIVWSRRGQDKGTITLTTRQDGDWAEIRIADTGCGIPESIRDRIFDPFFTTKDVGKGTGQGLAIAHDVVVRKHAGTLTFETVEGCGTSFIIRLPLREVLSLQKAGVVEV